MSDPMQCFCIYLGTYIWQWSQWNLLQLKALTQEVNLI